MLLHKIEIGQPDKLADNIIEQIHHALIKSLQESLDPLLHASTVRNHQLLLSHFLHFH